MSSAARSDASPISDRFRLDDIVTGLAGDLDDLRAGRISVQDAQARANLARQIMNGVRMVIAAQKFLEANLPPALPATTETNQ